MTPVRSKESLGDSTVSTLTDVMQRDRRGRAYGVRPDDGRDRRGRSPRAEFTAAMGRSAARTLTSRTRNARTGIAHVPRSGQPTSTARPGGSAAFPRGARSRRATCGVRSSHRRRCRGSHRGPRAHPRAEPGNETARSAPERSQSGLFGTSAARRRDQGRAIRWASAISVNATRAHGVVASDRPWKSPVYSAGNRPASLAATPLCSTGGQRATPVLELAKICEAQFPRACNTSPHGGEVERRSQAPAR